MLDEQYLLILLINVAKLLIGINSKNQSVWDISCTLSELSLTLAYDSL